MQKAAAYTLGGLVLIAGLLLYSGHPVLNRPGPFGLPAGNWIAWAALIALPSAQLLGLYHKQNREKDPRIGVFYIGSLGALTLSLLWGVLSYGLAGNWAFVFQQQEAFVGSTEAANYFFYLSAATAALPLLILVLYLIYRSLEPSADTGRACWRKRWVSTPVEGENSTAKSRKTPEVTAIAPATDPSIQTAR